MSRKKFWRAFAALAVTGALFGLAPAGAAADQIADYPLSVNQRTFSGGVDGWTSSTASKGLCVPAVNCPLVSNTFQSSGGAGGEGYIRTGIISIASAGGEVSGIWQSPTFTYNGVKGATPDKLTFYLDRRADVAGLLTVTGGNADFTVDLVDQATGTAVNVIGPSPLGGATGWRAIPAVDVDPSLVTVGHSYRIRITSRFGFDAAVIPNSTADYDNVLLRARNVGAVTAGRAPGLNTALLSKNGKKLFIKVKCPKKAAPKKCRVTAAAVTKKRHGKRMTEVGRARVKAAKRRVMVLRVKDRYVNTLLNTNRVVVHVVKIYKGHVQDRFKKLKLKHL